MDASNAPNGMPHYLEEGYMSFVEVIPYATYQKLSTAEVQSKLHLHHLVITDMPQELGPIEFDEAGLQELSHLDSTIPIQGMIQFPIHLITDIHALPPDQSIPVQDGDLTTQVCFGTLEHILAEARDPNGAIINGLSFPLPLSAIKRDKVGGDVEAWRLTEGLPFCTLKVVFPTGDVRWALASTAGSRHWPHLDSNGFATFVDVLTGMKFWILFRPHLDNELEPSGSIDLFLNDFDTSVAVKTWDAELVVLTPGT